MPDYFLDSCIFFAYAYPHEVWHTKCVQFFNGDYNRFTGLRVRTEINKRLHKRRRLYADLAKYFERERVNPKGFVSTVVMNKNDRKHFESILSILRKKSNVAILTYLREKDMVTRKGIKEAFGKIQLPLVGLSSDIICEKIIESVTGNPIDAKIFVDAFVWSEETSNAIFITVDWTDFIVNRPRINRKLCEYRMIDSTANLPLIIALVDEIM